MLKTLLFTLVLPFSIPAWSQEGKLNLPRLSGPVVDQAGMIQPEHERLLDQLIRAFHQGGKGQIQILTLPNLNGLAIEQASIEVVDLWKLGDQKRDDGVLILVAAQERRVRIEVGQGLEGVLPDALAKRIIEDVMLPVFRTGSPSQGIVVGAYQVMKTIDPAIEAQVDGAASGVMAPRKGKSIADKFEGLFFLLFIIFMIIANIFGPRRRRFYGGGHWGGGFGGGGWGGGSGGGGWSGGGGGFSGGGASGGW
jgi:uncharacterized protein